MYHRIQANRSKARKEQIGGLRHSKPRRWIDSMRVTPAGSLLRNLRRLTSYRKPNRQTSRRAKEEELIPSQGRRRRKWQWLTICQPKNTTVSLGRARSSVRTWGVDHRADNALIRYYRLRLNEADRLVVRLTRLHLQKLRTLRIGKSCVWRTTTNTMIWWTLQISLAVVVGDLEAWHRRYSIRRMAALAPKLQAAS